MIDDKFYILVGKKIVPVDLLTWGKWSQKANKRIVAKTHLPGRVMVSTVFLGMDHGWGGHGSPLLFETMIFGGKYDTWQERYYTLLGAKAGHKRAVMMMKKYKRAIFVNRDKKYKNNFSKLPFFVQMKLKHPRIR